MRSSTTPILVVFFIALINTNDRLNGAGHVLRGGANKPNLFLLSYN